MPFKSHARRPFSPPTPFDPAALCAAYHLPRVVPARPAVIGIIELGGGYKPTDITTAFGHWKLPAPQLHDVGVQGAANSPGQDADGEVVLDIEVAAAVYAYCTGRPATVRTYFAPNTDSGFVAAIRKAVADKVDVISISWGGPEDQWSPAAIQAMNSAFHAARSAGIPVFAASGDSDSGDGEAGLHVDYPASDPYVVGCGGTRKSASAETVWNDGRNGTGGGYSVRFPMRATQVGAPHGPGRMVPDVAGNADPATGYNVYLDGQWTVIGGTSAVAPLYAGLFSALKAANLAPAGLLPEALWAAKTAFSDVAVGNNGRYRAQPGPDPCTGLGVPNGAAMVAALAPHPAPPPHAVDYFAVNWPALEVAALRLVLDSRLKADPATMLHDVTSLVAALGLKLPQPPAAA